MPIADKPRCPRCGLAMRRFNDHNKESWICDQGPTGAHEWAPDESGAKVAAPTSSPVTEPTPRS